MSIDAQHDNSRVRGDYSDTLLVADSWQLPADLRSSRFPRGAGLGSLAARVGLAAALAFSTWSAPFLGLGGRLTLFALGLLRAQALGRRTQPAAHALGLLLLRCRFLLGLGVRIVLAADQLDAGDVRAVP